MNNNPESKNDGDGIDSKKEKEKKESGYMSLEEDLSKNSKP
jgi:hypothetical protein